MSKKQRDETTDENPEDERQETGGTVGAAIYAEPAARVNPQPEPPAGPVEEQTDEREPSGGTVGAAIYAEPGEPVNPDADETDD